jgi:hypothetical protein
VATRTTGSRFGEVFGPTLARAHPCIPKCRVLPKNSALVRTLAVLSLTTTLALTTGCGGDTKGTGGSSTPAETPTDIAGDYTVDLVNNENTCPDVPDSWKEGGTTEGVLFSIEQKGVELTAETMGTAALAFIVRTGSNAFAGEIHDSHFVMTDHGTKEDSYGDCTYTLDVIVEGDSDGDMITGTVTYKPVIDQSAVCADYDCAAVQAFSGSRASK